KFGFNSGLRAEVIFVNTKEFMIKWGTKNAINIPTQRMPGGIPIRSFGAFQVKISDYFILIDKIAGIKQQFSVEDVKERTLALLDQLLLKWISREGKDIFNLQANSFDISKGIKEDLDMEMIKIGLTVTNFTISSFNYPEKIQEMIEKNASYEMVGDVSRYQNIGMMDAMEKNPQGSMGNMATSGMGMFMGMEMAKKMSDNINHGDSQRSNQSNNQSNNQGNDESGNNTVNNNSKFKCSNCGNELEENAKFCSNCGTKVQVKSDSPKTKVKFCSNCGNKLESEAKFCNKCGESV
ncbi:MAG: SPFH domain-containing protein, partial [Clostridiaceae bacterium]